MNKQSFLEETYNSAFEDELEKISGAAGKAYDVASKSVRNFGIPLVKDVANKKKGIAGIIANMKKAKGLGKG